MSEPETNVTTLDPTDSEDTKRPAGGAQSAPTEEATDERQARRDERWRDRARAAE